MPITNSERTPNRGDGERDPMIIYIEQTKGVWLRWNIKAETFEFWLDGVMQESVEVDIAKEMAMGLVDATRVELLLEIAIMVGERKRATAIADLLKVNGKLA